MHKIRISLMFVVVFSFGSIYGEESFEKVASKLTSLFNKVENQEMSILEGVLQINENDIDFLLKPSVISSEGYNVIAKGDVACTGAAQGVLCFDLNKMEEKGKGIIWVTDRINNDDLCHLDRFSAIFSINEDPSSHAIIVTRVYNIPCITLPSNVILSGNRLITPNGVYNEGDEVTLDAFNGLLISGNAPLYTHKDQTFLKKISDWSEQYAKLEVHCNADNAKEASEALYFGAKGVDPRTEHMFFHPQRLNLFRKAILSKGENESILNDLKELQKGDFVALFQTMKHYPVKIRLLDPPLHEFLPHDEEIIIALAKDLGIPFDELEAKINLLQETNPMMGHRGIRLLLTHPAILKMQVSAIFEAALDPSVAGDFVVPHIVIPMIISAEEVMKVKELVEEVYQKVSFVYKKPFVYRFGIMMETPRACLLAKEIAPYVDFISFGTNDLTGQTLALSRGDVYDKFLKFYLDSGLLKSDPFSEIDPAVKELMRLSVEQMKSKNPEVTVGICGEHASQKSGVFICHQLGFDTVSCAAFRVPIVKLLAAQAAILSPRE